MHSCHAKTCPSIAFQQQRPKFCGCHAQPTSRSRIFASQLLHACLSSQCHCKVGLFRRTLVWLGNEQKQNTHKACEMSYLTMIRWSGQRIGDSSKERVCAIEQAIRLGDVFCPLGKRRQSQTMIIHCNSIVLRIIDIGIYCAKIRCRILRWIGCFAYRSGSNSGRVGFVGAFEHCQRSLSQASSIGRIVHRHSQLWFDLVLERWMSRK